MKCPYCQEKIVRNFACCPYCGESLDQKKGTQSKTFDFKKVFLNVIKSVFVIILLVMIGIAGQWGYKYYMITSLYGTTKLGLDDIEVKTQKAYKDADLKKIFIDAYALSSNAIRKYEDKDMPYAIKGTAAFALSGLESKNFKQRRKNHNFEESKTLIDKALSINPNNYIALQIKSAFFNIDGDYDNALKYINKAIEQGPKCARAYFMRASLKFSSYPNVEVMRNNYDDFTKDLNDSIKFAPKNPFYYEARAGIKLLGRRNTELKSALEDANKSIELLKDPPASFYITRAKIKAEMKNYSEALEDCDKAIDLSQKQDSLSEKETKLFFNVKEYQELRSFLENKI